MKTIYPHVQRHDGEQLLGGDFFAEEPDLIRLRCRVLAVPTLSDFRPYRQADLAQILLDAARRPGTKVVLLGDRGSGKSTALRQLGHRLAGEVARTGDGPYPIFLTVDRHGREPGGPRRADSVLGHVADPAGCADDARVYLIDGLDEMTRTPGDSATVSRLLREYLALADRDRRTSVVISCRSTLWLSDITQRQDALVLEVSSPTRTELIAAARAARGREAEPLLKRLGLDPHDPTVALAMMNHTLFARILLSAEPGWDTVHLRPLELIDHLLEDWTRHATGSAYFYLDKAETGAAATGVAGWLFERGFVQRFLPHSSTAGDAVATGRDPFLIADKELWYCLRSVGISAGGAARVRSGEIQLSPYIERTELRRDGQPLYGFVRDEARFYFTARYLCRESRLESWLACPETFWAGAAAFPDDVAGILRYALLMRSERQPDRLPRILEQLLATFGDFPAGLDEVEEYRERASRLFVLVGAYEGILKTCGWTRCPRLRSVVKGLVSRLAAIYDDDGHRRAELVDDTRYYAARRASHCGFEFVEVIWNWCSRSESVHQRLFAVEVARQYGVYQPGAEVLRLMVSLAKIEQEALSQDYRQQRKTGAPVRDEVERQHLLYHLMEGIHGVFTAVAVPAVDIANVDRVVEEVLHPAESKYLPVVQVLAHCIQVAGGGPGLDLKSREEAARRCLQEAGDTDKPAHFRVHAMKAYSLLCPDDLLSFAGFLAGASVFLGEEILPIMGNAALSSLTREEREVVARSLQHYIAETCVPGSDGMAGKRQHLRAGAEALVAALRDGGDEAGSRREREVI